MLRRNVDPAVITALVGRLVEAVAPLRPRLVYLARRDPEGAFRAIGEQRGIAWLLHHMTESGSYQFLQTRGLSGQRPAHLVGTAGRRLPADVDWLSDRSQHREDTHA
jgi:hypothetical protein